MKVVKVNITARKFGHLISVAAMVVAAAALQAIPAQASPSAATSGGKVFSIAGFRTKTAVHINQMPASWHGVVPKNVTPGAVCSNPNVFWNENSNKVMEVFHSQTQDGANVDQWSFNGSNTQKWCLFQIPDQLPVFEIVNQNSGKCLDVTNDTPKNGTNVQQWGCLNNENQAWVQGTAVGNHLGNNWEPAMDIDHGYGFELEVFGSSQADGGNVDIWQFNNSSTQFWCPVNCHS